MKVIYVADDGKRFNNEQACIEYEKRGAMKDKRREEIRKLMRQYEEDYGETYNASQDFWQMWNKNFLI